MAIKFNNDLLIGLDDAEKARAEFPHVLFALDHPALKEVFRPIDRRANAAKTKSRRWGVAAVFLATISLMLAASEALYHDFDKHVIRFIAVIGAIAGIASVFIGVFGVMFRERKIQWLADRLSTERIRQFNFQTYVAFAADILNGAANNDAARAFVEKRSAAFEKFKTSVIDRAPDELHRLVEAEDPGDGLFFPEHIEKIPADAPHLDEYLRAYTLLRFERQIGYCDLMLREKGGLWKYAPVKQARILGATAMFCVFAILVLHGLVFVGAIADMPALKSPEVHVAAILAAIIALAARTIEEGFQPETEVERLRLYRLSLRRIYQRFTTSTDMDDKLKAMIDLEKLSFEEMVLFLRSNYEAQFVM